MQSSKLLREFISLSLNEIGFEGTVGQEVKAPPVAADVPEEIDIFKTFIDDQITKLGEFREEYKDEIMSASDCYFNVPGLKATCIDDIAAIIRIAARKDIELNTDSKTIASFPSYVGYVSHAILKADEAPLTDVLRTLGDGIVSVLSSIGRWLKDTYNSLEENRKNTHKGQINEFFPALVPLITWISANPWATTIICLGVTGLADMIDDPDILSNDELIASKNKYKDSIRELGAFLKASGKESIGNNLISLSAADDTKDSMLSILKGLQSK